MYLQLDLQRVNVYACFITYCKYKFKLVTAVLALTASCTYYTQVEIMYIPKQELLYVNVPSHLFSMHAVHICSTAEQEEECIVNRLPYCSLHIHKA